MEIFVDIRYISSLKTINPVCCECHAHYKKSCCAENYTYECAATWKKSSCVLRFIHYRINSSSAFLHSCAVQAQQRVIIIFSTSIKINKNQSRVRMSACAVSSHFTHDHLSLSLFCSQHSRIQTCSLPQHKIVTILTRFSDVSECLIITARASCRVLYKTYIYKLAAHYRALGASGH